MAAPAPPARPPDRPLPPAIGPYRVEALLGRGAMGEVFRCRDPIMKRTVAVKLLSEKMAAVPACVDRFEREVVTLASLSHPNVVRAYSIGRIQRSLYLAMECVEGTDLERRIRGRGRLPPAEALAVALSAAEGLAAASALGVKHCDVKASNILLSDAGGVKVSDFGLAQPLNETPGGPAKLVMGTPHYMAPEVAMGNPFDHRADMYALGLTLYQMVSGSLPFTGKTYREILRQQVSSALPDLRAVLPGARPELDHVIGRLSAKRPDDRFPHWGEAIAAIAGVHQLWQS